MAVLSFFDASGALRYLEVDLLPGNGSTPERYLLKISGTQQSGGSGGIAESVSINNFPSIQNTSFGGVAQPVTINNASVPVTINGTLTTQGNLGWYPNRQNQTGTTGVIKNTSGRIRAFKAENLNETVTRFLLLFDRSTNAPVNATTGIIDVFNIPPNTVMAFGSDYFSTDGVGFSNGLVFAWSTTRSEYAAASTADLDVSFIII